jgi:hypothetical protein
MPTFVNPVAEIVKKMRLDSDLTARVAISRIHVGYPKIVNGEPTGVDKPGIYVHRASGEMKFVFGPSSLTDAPKYGSASYQVDVFSSIGVSDADEIAALSQTAVGESVPNGGLYSIYFIDSISTYDEGFDCYHSIFIISVRLKRRDAGVTLLG